ncbi:hypothetical protein [Dactylosporangium sp. CA-139066]|uniref:hypothetical protein n=1 Tax=Dactylosporangium sp. CA-139066 TaxID=3239930 RepID=UPI003D8B5997
MAGEPTDEAWPVFSGLHRVLLHLAGRMPDDWMIEARAWLGRAELEYMPDLISGGVAGAGVSLPAADVELLRRLQAQYAGPEAPAGIDLIPTAEEIPPTAHRFAPARPGQTPERDEHDYSAAAINVDPFVVTVARAWRTGPDGDAPTRVFLVEVDPGAEAWTVAADLARLLDWSDERPAPQIEVYWTGEPLPPYHTAALAGALPLWHREGGPDLSRLSLPLVERFVDATLRGDLNGMRRAIDWPLTGAPRVAARLAALDPAELEDWAGDMVPRLFTAGDTIEGVMPVLRQVTGLLGDSATIHRPDAEEAREILDRLRIPPVPGLSEGHAARLAELSRRAESLSEVYLVHGGSAWLPLVWAPDTDRLVLVYE